MSLYLKKSDLSGPMPDLKACNGAYTICSISLKGGTELQ